MPEPGLLLASNDAKDEPGQRHRNGRGPGDRQGLNPSPEHPLEAPASKYHQMPKSRFSAAPSATSRERSVRASHTHAIDQNEVAYMGRALGEVMRNTSCEK